MSESDSLTSRRRGNQGDQSEQTSNNDNDFQALNADLVNHPRVKRASCCVRCNARASVLIPLWVVMLLALAILSAIDGHWQGILIAALGVPILLPIGRWKRMGCCSKREVTPLQPNSTSEYGTGINQEEPIIVTAYPCASALRVTLIVLKWFYVFFLFFAVAVRAGGRSTARDWSTFPTSCIDSSPNCCRVTPNDNCTSSFVDPAPALELQAFFDTDVYAPEVLSQVKGFFGLGSDQVGWFSGAKLNAETLTADGFTLHIVVLTPLMGFPDDVAVRVSRMQCSGEGGMALVVEMQSKSRLGYGDAGVNYLRLQKLQQHIEAYASSLSGDAAGSCQIDQIE